jgi:hypothetical protein
MELLLHTGDRRKYPADPLGCLLVILLPLSNCDMYNKIPYHTEKGRMTKSSNTTTTKKGLDHTIR